MPPKQNLLPQIPFPVGFMVEEPEVSREGDGDGSETDGAGEGD